MYCATFEELNRYYESEMSFLDYYVESQGGWNGTVIDKIYSVVITYIGMFQKLKEIKDDQKYLEKAIKTIEKMEKIPEFKQRKFPIYLRDAVKDGRFNIFSLTAKERDLFTKNIATAVLYGGKPKIDKILNTYYDTYGQGGTTVYFDVNDAKKYLTTRAMYYDAKIRDIKNLLKNTGEMIKKTKEFNNRRIVDDFRYFCDRILYFIYIRKYITVQNREDIMFSLRHGIKDFLKKEGKKNIKLNYFYEKDGKYDVDSLVKNAKYDSTIPRTKDNGQRMKFNLYYADYDDLTPFTFPNGTIYVSKKFLTDYSVPIQNAILLHEIGHHLKGHFEMRGIRDDRLILKEVKKTEKEIIKKLRNRGWKLKSDNTEFVFLIMRELEADRYAAKYIGKRLVKKSLNPNKMKEYNNRRDIPNKDLQSLMLNIRRDMI